MYGHACLRDFKDRLPAPRSREPTEYPVKARPSELKRLAKRFRYQPYNLRYPSDTMIDVRLEEQLKEIGDALCRWFPPLRDSLTPEVLSKAIQDQGEDAWCEQRWIEDYSRHLATASADG